MAIQMEVWLRGSALLLMGLILVSSSASAQTKYPGISYIQPLTLGRGQTTTVLVEASDTLESTHTILVEGDGITGKVLPKAEKQKKEQVRLELTVAPTAAVGPREIRLATQQAITTLANIYITDYPTLVEADKHQSRTTAQEISLPCAVSGQIAQKVEEDWYKFQCKQDQQLTLSVLGTRLHSTIHKIGRFITHFDAMITLVDEQGLELAANDDHYFADPLLSYTIPRDGTYYVCVREATYQGTPFYTYSLMATTDPYPQYYYPLAVPPGQTQTIQVLPWGGKPNCKCRLQCLTTYPLALIR